MWSTRTARCPRARSRRCLSRCACAGHDPSYRTRVGTSGRGARRPCRTLSLNGTSRSHHSASTWARSCGGVPPLSSHTSAAARRWSSSACAAIRARASASASPRADTRRDTRVASSACDDDDQVVGGAEVLLDQQRHVVHDDRVGGCRSDELRGPGPHERVGDLLEVGAGPPGWRTPAHRARPGPAPRRPRTPPGRSAGPPRRGRGCRAPRPLGRSGRRRRPPRRARPAGPTRWTCPTRCRR